MGEEKRTIKRRDVFEEEEEEEQNCRRNSCGKRNYSNFVSTTWLTFNDNCRVKMAVFFVAAVRLEAIFVRISRSFSAPRN